MILMAGMIGSTAVAQEAANFNLNAGEPSHVAKTRPSDVNRHPKNTDRAVESYWLNYAYDKVQDNPTGTTAAKTWWNYTFADSTVYVGSSPSFYRPSVYAIGNVLDVTAPEYQVWDGINWDATVEYTIDSMEIRYLYQRNTNNTVVDTLLVYLYHNATAANLGLYRYNAGTWTPNFGLSGSDSLWWKQQFFSSSSGTNNRPTTGAANGTAPPPSLVTIKVPLTIADTSWDYYGFKAFQTYGVGTSGSSPFLVPAGKLTAASMSFKPGFSYSPGDTITKSKNYFAFTFVEEQGSGTFPIYNTCPYPHKICDWNVSSIINRQSKYNVGSPGWSGFYIPTWAFGAGYGMEHNWTHYKVTSTTTSIKEATTVNGIKLGQNQPNPFNGNTLINYEIPTSENVSLDIFDIAGKKIISLNQGKQAAGFHSIEVSSQSLPQGVYFYTLNVGDKNVTKKMTVLQ